MRRKSKLYVADVKFLFEFLRRYRGLPMTEGLFQGNYVNGADGHPILDFVGRFESLSTGVRRVQQPIGSRFELPHLNATKRPHYRKFLTPTAASAARHLWCVDFGNFGCDDDASAADEDASRPAEIEFA